MRSTYIHDVREVLFLHRCLHTHLNAKGRCFTPQKICFVSSPNLALVSKGLTSHPKNNLSRVLFLNPSIPFPSLTLLGASAESPCTALDLVKTKTETRHYHRIPRANFQSASLKTASAKKFSSRAKKISNSDMCACRTNTVPVEPGRPVRVLSDMRIDFVIQREGVEVVNSCRNFIEFKNGCRGWAFS